MKNVGEIKELVSFFLGLIFVNLYSFYFFLFFLFLFPVFSSPSFLSQFQLATITAAGATVSTPFSVSTAWESKRQVEPLRAD